MKIYYIFFIFITSFLNLYGSYGDFIVSNQSIDNGFTIFDDKYCADIVVDKDDYDVVKLVADLFCNDLRLLSNREISPQITRSCNGKSVVIGTLGCNDFIDGLVSEGLLDVSSIKGKWESFIITNVFVPKLNDNVLVICGSDRRGTAFGVFTLSRKMGISPWYWWADVPVKKKCNLTVYARDYIEGEPSVKYRGLFINDESNGLFPWAINTIDKKLKDLGPNTYSKVFELLLRLKANYCWPAMHSCTKGFNHFSENRKLADKYAIVMGSSHCEQMLRNNVSEWDKATMGEWNYKTNRDKIYSYWEERVKVNSKYENTYTLGIRGIHDTSMKGVESMEEKVKYTQMAIDDQRKILSEYCSNVEEVPQVFCAYKEVMDIYKGGLKLPDDVTLLWADDNHGFMKHLPDSVEIKRSGGSGIYYHLSYFGDPEGWLWLSSMTPGVITYELYKSYKMGADRIWMFNVGDIKPAEKELTLALDMAWDIYKWTPDNVDGFISSWISDAYGDKYVDEMSDVMNMFYELSLYGKPEHVKFIDYTDSEINKRLEISDKIISRIIDLNDKIDDKYFNSYYQTIAYPALGAAYMNKYYLLSKRSLVKAAVGDDNPMLLSKIALECYHSLDSITNIYNSINGGKWDKMMYWRPYQEMHPGFVMPMANRETLEYIGDNFISKCIKVESNKSDNTFEYKFYSDKVQNVPLWIRTTSPIYKASFRPENNKHWKVFFNEDSFDASALPIGNIRHATHIGPIWSKVGELKLKKGMNNLLIQPLDTCSALHDVLIGFYPQYDTDIRWQTSATDCISSFGLVSLKGFGYNDALTLDYNKNTKEEAWAEYEIFVPKGHRTIEIHTLPTFPMNYDSQMRIGVSINNSSPEYYNLNREEFTARWQKNVLRGYDVTKITHYSDKDDRIKCKLFLPDYSVVIMRVVVK